ncbi:MAG TPA: HEAT repeat domain-containing protein, partial [Polyangia bacterium]|nr:HEAT repeat domain-containing protein [Polyangia bacterium]
VGSDGALESSSSLEKLAVILGQTEFRAETRVTLKLRERGQATAGPIVDGAGAGLLASTLYATGPADAVSAGDANEQRRRLVGGASAAELMRDMAALPPNKENQEARWNVKRRLTALVELDPTSAAAIARRLKTGASAEEGEMLLAALADSNRPEAQAALAALAADPEAPGRVRGAAVIHLGLQQHPSEETLSSLSALADQADGDQLKNSALLALGSAARQAAAAADNAAVQPAAKDAVEKLKTGYGAASDPEQRKVFLAALGNAGDPSTLSTIKAALSDDDPAVRAGAVASLRNIPGAEADGLILGVLPDTDGRVRNAALSALSDRPMTAPILEAVEGIARNDTVASLRAQAVLILGRNLALPGAQATLEWVREHDPVDKVRDAAAKSLQSPLAIRKN